MAETLKNRVTRVMASGVHALLDKLEDLAPEAQMEQSLRELDGIVDELRHELGRLSANRHLTQQRHAELNRQHEALQAQIQLAMEQGREELARAAVSRQLDIETQLPLLETSLAELARQELEHKSYVDALAAKKREMEAALLQFRQSRAAGTPAGVGGPGGAGVDAKLAAVTGAFDRVYERQTGLAGVARAQQLGQAAQLQTLEELVRQSQVDARMAQLKLKG